MMSAKRYLAEEMGEKMFNSVMSEEDVDVSLTFVQMAWDFLDGDWGTGTAGGGTRCVFWH